MLLIIGLVVVFGCVVGGFVALGGHLSGLWQPYEIVIVGGAGIGGLIMASSKETLAAIPRACGDLFRGPKYTKEDYMDLMGLLYVTFRTMKVKGNLAIESHVENPDNSSIFSQFPSFLKNETAVFFLCDYLRMMTMGTDDPHQIEELMSEEITTQKEELGEIPAALQQMADAFPGLGICAAVLGVIHTMDYITEPPAVIGGLIAAALVGTLLGVLLCYGLFGPMAAGMIGIYHRDIKYFECIKAGLIAYAHGSPPAIAVESARKIIFEDTRPTFQEVEQSVASLQTAD